MRESLCRWFQRQPRLIVAVLRLHSNQIQEGRSYFISRLFFCLGMHKMQNLGVKVVRSMPAKETRSKYVAIAV